MRNQLTGAQLEVVHYHSLPKAERPSIDEIAEKCGVSRSTIYAWQKDDGFIEAIRRQIVRNNADVLPDLVAALPRMALEEKSAAMAKLALQAHGMLTDRVEVNAPASGHATDVATLKARIEAIKARQVTVDEDAAQTE